MNFDSAKKAAVALVEKMTVEECISQLVYTAAPINRLGIREYNWWNEALHGVARAGIATVFPQAIGLAATFDPDLIGHCAEVIATEGRAKYNKSLKEDDRGIYKGLTYWSPNINIFRDPRWGRGQETFGEDPFLTADMGCHFIQGLQGKGEFLKAAACAKHFAAHSGPEGNRHSFDARVSKQDLYETYLPAFEWAVKHAGVAGVMGAYNRLNGEPCCASEELLQEILLSDWNFKGYVVSDCEALRDIHQYHHYTSDAVESAAIAVNRGCNLNCGKVFSRLVDAYESDLVTEETLRQAATRLFTIRCLLGEFEEKRPYSDISIEAVDCPAHQALNLEAAGSSLVLLKNEDGFLPLSPKKYRTIAAIGPNANSTIALEGNYNGIATEYITIEKGLRQVFADAKLTVSEGCPLIGATDTAALQTAVEEAKAADVTLLCLGLDRTLEGEEGDGNYNGEEPYCMQGDRCTLRLPNAQIELAEKICRECENVVVIVLAGSPVDLGETVRTRAKAILHAWYPGAAGGLAVAQLLAGEFSPSGRLPITFPYADKPLPDFEDYALTGRTYRFTEETPLYPFGFGLGFTQFTFTEPLVTEIENGYTLQVTVTNCGSMPAKAPIQVYARFTDSKLRTPAFQLCGLKKVPLEAGERKSVSLTIDRYWLMAVDEEGHRVTPDGSLTLFVGDRQPDRRSEELSDSHILNLSIR